jgi:hypothetical protein
MNSQCTLPSTRGQAHQALLLLGAPAPARLVVDVHAALFDGDLDMPSLVALLRAEERGTAGAAGVDDSYKICWGLNLNLTAARSLVALAAWPVGRRIVTPAVTRADALAMVVRVVEFVAVQPAVGASAARLLRRLAADVPGGPEAVHVLDPGALADAARLALADPALAGAVAGEQAVREDAAARAAQLEVPQQLFGVPAVPQQRGHA